MTILIGNITTFEDINQKSYLNMILVRGLVE